MVRLFARDLYQMRRGFEAVGRPPYPSEFAGAIEQTRRLCPTWTSMERRLEQRGYASKPVA